MFKKLIATLSICALTVIPSFANFQYQDIWTRYRGYTLLDHIAPSFVKTIGPQRWAQFLQHQTGGGDVKIVEDDVQGKMVHIGPLCVPHNCTVDMAYLVVDPNYVVQAVCFGTNDGQKIRTLWIGAGWDLTFSKSAKLGNDSQDNDAGCDELGYNNAIGIAYGPE
jgi:hypothetical protein